MLGSIARLSGTWGRVRPLRRQTYALLVLLVGTATSIAAALWLHARALEASQATFERRTRNMQIAISSHFDAPLAMLRAVPLLFAASNAVETREFSAFVRSTLQRDRGVLFVGWAPELSDEERAAFERRAREGDWPSFSVRDLSERGAIQLAPKRAQYMPLLHLEPAGTPLLGVDLLADPERAEAIRRALRGGDLTAAPGLERTAVVTESVLVFAPLTEVAPESHDPRAPRRGVAVLALRTAPFVHESVARTSFHGLDLVLLDTTAGDTSRVLFESSPGAALLGRADADMIYDSPVVYCGRRWVYRFLARPGTLSAGAFPYIVGVLGIALSFAAMLALGALEIVRRLRREVTLATQLGQYRLVRKISEGGMGVVYQAEHALLRRPTAIKLISQRPGDASLIARFEREVTATSKLSHPNTIVVFDFGRTPQGVFYYAMEYLPGVSIDELVRAVGPLLPQRVVHLLVQVCGSLREAHQQGLVHRDIKPGNLMVCERGGIADFVKVLDFGLVKDVAEREVSRDSRTGQILGTPQYMAPESMRGHVTPSPVIDIYGVGAVAYFLLTGHDAFEPTSLPALISRQLEGEPEPPSLRLGKALPGDLEALVLRCMARDPAQRPQSADALLAALEACDLPAWTQADARAFWAEWGERLLPRRSRTDDAAWSETLSVDLAARKRWSSGLGPPLPGSDLSPLREAGAGSRNAR